MLKQCLQLSSRVWTCVNGCTFCTILWLLCALLHKKENFGITVWNITGGWVGKGRDFVNVKTGKYYKTET